MNNKRFYTLFIALLLFVVCITSPAFAADGALFSDLIEKGSQIFMGMRDIIYVVSGFGIIGIAVGGFFGTINWKWLGAIIIGLMVIASTAAFIEYITGEKVGSVTDTLK